MSYLDVGAAYEKKYLQAIKDDPEEGCIFPCFQESSTNEILQERIGKRVDESLDNPDNFAGFITSLSIFGQYLADTYNVLPEDIEFMCQVTTTGIMETAAILAERVSEYYESGRAMIDGLIRPPKKNNVITPDFGNGNKGDG